MVTPKQQAQHRIPTLAELGADGISEVFHHRLGNIYGNLASSCQRLDHVRLRHCYSLSRGGGGPIETIVHQNISKIKWFFSEIFIPCFNRVASAQTGMGRELSGSSKPIIASGLW